MIVVHFVWNIPCELFQQSHSFFYLWCQRISLCVQPHHALQQRGWGRRCVTVCIFVLSYVSLKFETHIAFTISKFTFDHVCFNHINAWLPTFKTRQSCRHLTSMDLIFSVHWIHLGCSLLWWNLTKRWAFFKSFNLISVCGLFDCVESHCHCIGLLRTHITHVSSYHPSSTCWWLGLLHSLVHVYCVSPWNISQVPSAIWQLYAACTVGYAN